MQTKGASTNARLAVGWLVLVEELVALSTPLPGELSSNLGASVKRKKKRCLVHFKNNL